MPKDKQKEPKVKKGVVHLHNKPAPHVYNKTMRALCPWTAQSENDIMANAKQGRERRARKTV